jgi:hypothetical protein
MSEPVPRIKARISDRDTATKVAGLMNEAFLKVDESCSIVRETCAPEECKAFLKATAPIAGGIVMDVLEPIYDEYPELKPANWDGD